LLSNKRYVGKKESENTNTRKTCSHMTHVITHTRMVMVIVIVVVVVAAAAAAVIHA
jgi:hypothetical protein